MKIVLAIPTYKRKKHLSELLSQVVSQGFYKIYVLDDGSGLDYSDLEQTYSSVEFVYGSNVEPARNRNRILDEDMGDVVFFVDDDVRLRSARTPSIVSRVLTDHPAAAIVSARVSDHQGKPVNFWFDHETNPLFRWVEVLLGKQFLLGSAFDVPYISVAWVLENAFAVRSDVFRQLGGFDPAFRKFQEGPDLCKRAILAGYEVAITDKIKAQHTEPYSAFSLSQAPRYVISSIRWYWKHNIRRLLRPQRARR